MPLPESCSIKHKVWDDRKVPRLGASPLYDPMCVKNQYETANRKVESAFENQRIFGFENKTPLYDSLFRIVFSRKSDQILSTWTPP